MLTTERTRTLSRCGGVFSLLTCLLGAYSPYLAWGDTPLAEDANSTGAAQASDQSADELAQRLLDGRAADQDPMQRIMNLMDQSARRMHDRFDAGPQTQTLQQQIIKELDDAIDIALRNRSKMSASASSASDPRTMPDADRSSAESENGKTGEQSDAPQRPRQVADDARDQPRGGLLNESRRTWGRLPQRDRDQIMQGMDDVFVEPYRDLIEAYYESLAQTHGPPFRKDQP